MFDATVSLPEALQTFPELFFHCEEVHRDQSDLKTGIKNQTPKVHQNLCSDFTTLPTFSIYSGLKLH